MSDDIVPVGNSAVPVTPAGGEENERTNIERDKIVAEAKKRWERCADWESTFRARFVQDVKFANGDSKNGYQWPNQIKHDREVAARPTLTLNIVRQHNLMIANQARQNKSSVKFVGLGGGATKESAIVYNDLMRRMEYQSRAQSAYTKARKWQVDGGIGWWRLVTDWIPGTMYLDIFIQPVNDPLTVYMDPDCEQSDCSDAKFAFVFDTLPKDEFDEAYPDFVGLGTLNPLSVGGVEDDWNMKDHVRVVEYFRKVRKKDRLVSFVHLNERKLVKESLLHDSFKKIILDDPQTHIRDSYEEIVEWKLIVGSQIIDETIWPGKYIPLVRVIGEEYVIDGIMDRKGHTRAMEDAQRMYNYNSSGQVEFVALQGKTPWLAPAKAIEELEQMWNTANTQNHSVLIWNHVDDQNPDVPIPAPVRTAPPSFSPGFQAGMETAFNQMMMTSGQWQNEMGMMGNERTGKAIGLRQKQSDTAVFHFQDNYEEALQYTGRQFLDLVPKIYDTKRVMQITADDGSDYELLIDPSARETFFEELDHHQHIVRRILNPTKGRYDVASSVGPNFVSKNEETVEALTLILTQAPDLIPIIGDYLIGAMPFDKAQEAAQRIKRMVPPQALGQGPTPNEQQQMQQISALQTVLSQTLEKLGKEQVRLVGKDQMRDIDVYKAQTDRIKALKEMLVSDPQGLQMLMQQLFEEAGDTSLEPIMNANEDDLDGSLGAKKASDGNWYVPDPTRPGGYMKVERKEIQ